MTSREIREKYIKFFVERGHKHIPSAPLVPENDRTTLFISAGMQPLVPYLLGEPHPEGKKLVNWQKCLRMDDIDAVGDTSHHTFFEMLGNWSLGDYFKKESIPWSLEFLTKDLGLSKERISVSVFAGEDSVPRDEESAGIWKSLGIPESRIYYYGKKDNWWTAGPTGPCGPDTEIFYDVTGKPHGPNCEPKDNCGRYFEVWNNVFMVYNKKLDGSFEELPRKNVDTGMGLERITTVLQGKDDNYKTDIFEELYLNLKDSIKIKFNNVRERMLRIFLDHTRASIFLIADDVRPDKKGREYVLRKLIRRANDQLTLLQNDVTHTQSLKWWEAALTHYINIYTGVYKFNEDTLKIIKDELAQYGEVFSTGNLRRIEKRITPNPYRSQDILEENLQKYLKTGDTPSFMVKHSFGSLPSVAAGTVAFEAKSALGIPVEGQGGTLELTRQRLGSELQENEFIGTIDILSAAQQELSKVASTGMFKGGLMEDTPETRKLHTATHLLHAALRRVLGEHIKQMGSNITSERLRFDFSHPRPLSELEIERISELVNQKISENLPVFWEEKTLDAALKEGALAFFGEKYEDKVKVYTIGPSTLVRQTHHRSGSPFSREVCGGPHVGNTGEIGRVTITKEEGVGTGIRRIYAQVE